MSARDEALRLVDGARAQWRHATLARALLAGVAAALLAATGLAALDQVTDLPQAARAFLRFVPFALLWVLLIAAIRRIRRAPGDIDFALLIEERAPKLRGWVTTALAPIAGGPIGRLFEDRAVTAMRAQADHAWVPLVPRRLARAAAAASGIALVALVLLPGGGGELWRRWGALSALPPLIRAADGSTDVHAADPRFDLSGLRITVAPPAYAGASVRTLEDGEAIVALAGSEVRVTGPTPNADLEVSAQVIGGEDLSGAAANGRWSARWRLARGQRGLALLARAGEAVVDRRVVPITVVEDGEPIVRLDAPAEDVVLASARGVLPLRATATDDHGITDFHLSWILSRGGGESFSFTEGTWRWDARATRGDAIAGSYALDLAAADLEPGDVLHVRAIATDANDVTGPGTGVSATRLIRIARADELADVTTLIGFPIEAEKEPILSQRMIILLTERLIARLDELSEEERRAESAGIAREQSRLRDRLTDVVYSRTFAEDEHADDPVETVLPARPAGDTLGVLEWSRRMRAVLDSASAATGTGTIEELGHDHDPDPSISVNRALLGAFDAMYAAERSLLQADPRAALPHEYRALEILQRAREAERVFLRGRQAVAPVDVAGVRGTGELEDAEPAAPSPAEPLPTAAAALEEVTGVAERLPSLTPRAASLALSALAARLLADPSLDARAGALLSLAADAAGAGRAHDAAALTRQARAVLAPPSRATRGPTLHTATSALSADYFRRLRPEPAAGGVPRSAAADPFVFATVRYASGDWDSAQLVPANLIHSIALYTDIPVAPEGVIVDLDSPDIFRYPLLYLTGHLPVRFNAAESRNLREFVARGGLIFIDDHNHDIDGAFHRTVTAELRRIFGEDTLAPLPNDHELYRAFFVFEDGPPTTSHELNGWGDGLVHESLSAILVGGRIGVLYSNKDYSSEWSYHVQNKRFQALDNTRFGVNILVYALTR